MNWQHVSVAILISAHLVLGDLVSFNTDTSAHSAVLTLTITNTTGTANVRFSPFGSEAI
jgi:hypothetical protein